MSNQLTIVNAALARLGELPIADVADDSAAATVMRRIYAVERDAALTIHPWWWASRSQQVLVAPGTPPPGWTTQRALPQDLLRLESVRLDGGVLVHDFELASGGRLLLRFSDNVPVYVFYIARVPEADWPPWFRVYFELQLAVAACMGLTESENKTEAMKAQAERALRLARNFNAQMRPARRMRATALTGARRF